MLICERRHISLICIIKAALEAERDQLLAEKAALEESGATEAALETYAPGVEEAKRLWEAEKMELIKARDEALTNLKVTIPLIHRGLRLIFPQAATEEVQKVSEEGGSLRHQNVRTAVDA